MPPEDLVPWLTALSAEDRGASGELLRAFLLDTATELRVGLFASPSEQVVGLVRLAVAARAGAGEAWAQRVHDADPRFTSWPLSIWAVGRQTILPHEMARGTIVRHIGRIQAPLAIACDAAVCTRSERGGLDRPFLIQSAGLGCSPPGQRPEPEGPLTQPGDTTQAGG